MAIAIETQGLGKRYRILHKKTDRYVTLRDTLANVFKNKELTTEEDFWALREVDLEIQQGERVGIIGRNGAGKSTLLKLLSRITEPSVGGIHLNGRVSSLLEVGTGFHPELSGRENIYLNGAILGMNRREITTHFDEIVAFSEVEQFLDTPVKRYSSGMYMRLAFAVAAHLDSDVLLIDEVLAVGDAAFQKRCLSKMDSVANDGRTVLLVSHRMGAIENLCDRVIALREGTVMLDTYHVNDGIRQYLNDQDQSYSWCWEANNDLKIIDGVQLHSLYLTDSNKTKVLSPVANDENIQIHIEATLSELDPALSFGYAIYSEDGHLLYWSNHTDSHEDAWPKLRLGDNHLVTSIPGRFLNEGEYRVELMVSLHYRKWIYEPEKNAPFLRLVIQGGLCDSPLWIEKRPGLLAPVISWENQL